MNYLAASLAVLCLLPHASAVQGVTWTVDPTGQTGQFTDLNPAIAIAAPGDKILVAGGSYGDVSLSKGLTIVGSPLQFSVLLMELENIPAGETAVVMNARARAVQVEANSGAVLLKRVTVQSGNYTGPLVRIENSIDVRLHELEVWALAGTNGPGSWGSTSGRDGIYCANSRIELLRSTVVAGDAKNGFNSGSYCFDYYINFGSFFCQAPNGGIALNCIDASRLHLVGSSLVGGRGADERYLNGGGVALDIYNATNGGAGLVSLNSIAIGVQAGGGIGGIGGVYPDGEHGHGTEGAVVRQTGSRLRVAPATPAPAAVPRDPMLDLIGTPTPGSNVTLRFKGKPGLRVRFETGDALVVADGMNEVERLTAATSSASAGNVPNSGILSYAWSIPASATTGDVVWVQGVQLEPSTGTIVGRSNSIAIAVP